jgi:hypothetical protein
VSQDVGVVLDGFHDHVGDGRLAQVEGSTAGFVQQSIHGGKCLSGVERIGRENPVGRQTVMEAPREEDGVFRLINVRKSPPVEGHTGGVPLTAQNSQGRQADQGVGCGWPRGHPGSAPPSTRSRTFSRGADMSIISLAIGLCRLYNTSE